MGKFNGKSNPDQSMLGNSWLPIFCGVVAVTLLTQGCSSQRTPNDPAPAATAATAAPSATAATAVPPPPPPPPQPADEAPTPLPPEFNKPVAPFEGTGWREMFDGESLDGWRITDFAGKGSVECRSEAIILGMGDPFTGLNFTNEFPKLNYEIALDAMRLMGTDFFCGLTLPYKDSHFSLIVGGWGGGLVGISSLDGMDASENETSRYLSFEKGKWYRLRVRATENRIEAWVSDEQVANVKTTDRRIGLRPGEIENSKPMGIASWQTGAAVRAIKLRTVTEPFAKEPKF